MTAIRLEINARTPVANGAPFGDAGPYEQIGGVLRFAIDPKHPRNAAIADLDLAPHEEDGRVHFAADVLLMRPVDPAKGNRRLFFDVLNRGRKTILRFN